LAQPPDAEVLLAAHLLERLDGGLDRPTPCQTVCFESGVTTAKPYLICDLSQQVPAWLGGLTGAKQRAHTSALSASQVVR
jgi:hypothetical protein